MTVSVRELPPWACEISRAVVMIRKEEGGGRLILSISCSFQKSNRVSEEQPGLKPWVGEGAYWHYSSTCAKSQHFQKGILGLPLGLFPEYFLFKPMGCLISALRNYLNQNKLKSETNQGTIIVTRNQVKKREWLPQN